MIEQPFALLAPFKEKIDVRFFTREDDLSDDVSVAKALGTESFVTLEQVHVDATIIVDHPAHRTEHADGAATKTGNLALVMRIADCQPLIVYAPEHDMIGMIHAGWKGVVAGVIPMFYTTVEREWGIRPEETLVGIGPSLCQACAEFTDPAKELPNVDPRFFSGRCVDSRGAADAQLDAIGVPASQRERSSDCVKCMHDKYWSYRSRDPKAFTENYRNMVSICLK